MPQATTSYTASLQRLYAYERTGMRLGLDGPRALHAAVGHPERAFRTLQVAGTNGKGTTAACLHAILRAAGIRSGLYTSPHLIDFSERMRVDGRAAAPAAIERLLERLAPIAEAQNASYFETVTALAALVFAEAEVEIAVAEVGIGGRLDATTVWPAALGAITAIDLDHMHILGSTLEEIAREKAGIAREGMTVIVGEARPALQRVIEDDVRARGGECVVVGRDADVRVGEESFECRLPDSRVLRDVRTSLRGAHQVRNAAVAALLALHAGDPRITEQSVRDGLARVRWPGRADTLTVRGVRVMLDVAHNPAAAARLATTIASERPIVVLGMLEDKDADGVAGALAPATDGAVITQPEWKRALPADALARVWRSAGGTVLHVEPVLSRAIDTALARAADGLLLVTGSCYTVGHALPYLGVHSLDVI